MSYLSILKVGALDAPAVLFKQDPLTALGVGSAIASGIGSLIGTSSSNSANKKIAREQMSWQTSEREKAQQWQERMWNLNNQYNTPSAVRARLQQAGYNPWLSGSNQVGQGSSMPNIPSMPSAPGMPTQQAVDYGAPFRGASDALFSMANLQLQSQGVKATSELNNQKAFQQVLDNATTMLKMGEPRAAIHRYVSENTPYATGVGNNNVYNMFMSQYQHQMALTSLAQTEDAWKSFEYQLNLRWSDAERRQNYVIANNTLEEIVQRIAESKGRVRLTATQVLSEIAKALNLDANTRTLNALRPFVVSSARYKADMDMYSRGDAYADYDANSLVRDYKHSDKGKSDRFDSFDSLNSEYSEVWKYIEGILQNIPIIGAASKIFK